MFLKLTIFFVLNYILITSCDNADDGELVFAHLVSEYAVLTLIF